MKRTTLFFSLLLLSGSSFATDGEMFLGLQLGSAHAKIKGSYAVSNTTFQADNVESGLIAGYHFDNDLILQANYLANDSFEIFGDLGDNYNINQYQVLAGYSINLNDRVRIVPKAGFSFWDLYGEEGIFLNPGDEKKVKFSGNDFVWSLGAEIALGQLVLLELSYANNNFEFGNTSTTSLGIKFEF